MKTYLAKRPPSAFSSKGVEMAARMHRDMALEVAKTVPLMKHIGTLVMKVRDTPSYQKLGELELLNQRLEDIISEFSFLDADNTP